MENQQIQNIVTYSNTLELTKRVVKEVGFEFQSELDDATIEEIVSGQVLRYYTENKNSTKGNA